MSTKGSSSSARWMAVGGRPVIVMAFPPGEALFRGSEGKSAVQHPPPLPNGSAPGGAVAAPLPSSDFAMDRDGVIGPGREGPLFPRAPPVDELQPGGRGQIVVRLHCEAA